jgi:murein DD-endopeptidase MepM/ murein hydrolase activator NlpD
MHERLSITEVFGLTPIGERLREAVVALRGDALTPPSRFDHTSLRMFRPRMALPLWLGRAAEGRLVPIYNLYNYNQPPPEEGWSVRVTNARDFLGTQLTYDSHNGTDFAVPIGTMVVAAAPGRVVRISREFNRGGLKVFLDHGNGLITTSNHLGRALVGVGDYVRRGDVIARSAYSGLDGLTTFPFGAPHVHFNVWLNGAYVDPFARDGVSLWREGNWPVPFRGVREDGPIAETDWDHDAVQRAIVACEHHGSRSEIEHAGSPDARAITAMFHMNYYPTRFRARPTLYRTTHPRVPLLDLPFRAEDFDGIMFPHGTEPPRIAS